MNAVYSNGCSNGIDMCCNSKSSETEGNWDIFEFTTEDDIWGKIESLKFIAVGTYGNMVLGAADGTEKMKQDENGMKGGGEEKEERAIERGEERRGDDDDNSCFSLVNSFLHLLVRTVTRAGLLCTMHVWDVWVKHPVQLKLCSFMELSKLSVFQEKQ